MEGKLLEAAASAGYIDPAAGMGFSSGDAVDKNVHLAMVDIMNFIVKSRIQDSYYIQKYRWYVGRAARAGAGPDRPLAGVPARGLTTGQRPHRSVREGERTRVEVDR